MTGSGTGSLAGKVAVITGGGQGLGREHALLFAREGARVVVNDLRGSAGVAEEIRAGGGEAVALDGDVGDLRTGAAALDLALQTFGGLHIVVNNAGFIRDKLLASMGEDDFDAVIRVHLRGTFSFTQAAARYWKEESKAGRNAARAVVNTSSISGLHGIVGQFNYSAAKAGIAAMTIVAAQELARFGVRVNCIAPGARTAPVLATPAFAQMVAAPEDPDAFDYYHPRNVSPLVAYLASERCRFNGQVFGVHGGFIGLYRGWSCDHTIDGEGYWDIARLAEALDAFPTTLPSKTSAVG
jgi:NAD(P)-dependent dehydrogenase (short-subunit alcohol dehydrogenase family)